MLRVKDLAAVHYELSAIIGKTQMPGLGRYRSSGLGFIGLHNQRRADQTTVCDNIICELDKSHNAVTRVARPENSSSCTFVQMRMGQLDLDHQKQDFS